MNLQNPHRQNAFPDPHQKGSNTEDPKNGRRGFIRGIAAGVATLAGVNKFLVGPAKEKNDFYNKFRNNITNYDSVVSATQILLSEMNVTNMHRVELGDKEMPNYRIEILRDFLQTHLYLKGVGDRYTVSQKVLSQGYFTRDELVAINNEAAYLAPYQQNQPDHQNANEGKYDRDRI
jgi:hypothetical protein